jgi:hypothetical protein
MLDLDEWRTRSRNASACVALPATITQISDSFVVIERLAPGFDGLQRAVDFPVSMDMMFGVLLAAIDTLATRCKRPDGRVAYLQSSGSLHQAYADFRDGELERARLRTQFARHLYRQGALPRCAASEGQAALDVQQRIDELAAARP